MKNNQAAFLALIAGCAVSVASAACPPESSGGDTARAPVAAGPIEDPGKSGLRFDPSHPQWKAYLAQQKKLKAAEKDFRKIRHAHFVTKKDVENRRAGLEKIRAHTDPLTFPAMITVFQEEHQEVRAGMLDHIASQPGDSADAALTWAAIYGATPDFRTEAAEVLVARLKGRDSVPIPAQSVIAQGFESSKRQVLGASANLVQQLKLWEAIPTMIAGQVQGTRDDADPYSLIAWILIGTQRTFVADLTPIVGDNAIGFDPVPGVITEGTLLKVQNAVVTQYITEVHVPLVALTTEGWGGRSTAHLGYDRAKWAKWYQEEFLPYRAQAEKLAREAAGDAKSGSAGDAKRGSAADSKSASESKTARDSQSSSSSSSDSQSSRDSQSSSSSHSSKDSKSSSNSSNNSSSNGSNNSSSSGGKDASTGASGNGKTTTSTGGKKQSGGSKGAGTTSSGQSGGSSSGGGSGGGKG